MSSLGFGSLSETRTESVGQWKRVTYTGTLQDNTHKHTQSHTPCEEWQWSICVVWKDRSLDHRLCDLAQVERVYLCVRVCVCVFVWQVGVNEIPTASFSVRLITCFVFPFEHGLLIYILNKFGKTWNIKNLIYLFYIIILFIFFYGAHFCCSVLFMF